MVKFAAAGYDSVVIILDFNNSLLHNGIMG